MTPERASLVVEEARSWIGTPYHHMGNVKGEGVDCGMIVIEVFSKLGAFPWFDPRPYSRQFHFHKDVEWYLSLLQERGPETPEPVVGGVAIWKVGRLYSHGGIITGAVPYKNRLAPVVVHAHAGAEFCLEEAIDKGPLARADVKYFDLWSQP